MLPHDGHLADSQWAKPSNRDPRQPQITHTADESAPPVGRVVHGWSRGSRRAAGSRERVITRRMPTFCSGW